MKNLLLSTVICLIAYHVQATTDRYRLMFNSDPSTTITVAWEQVSGSNPEVYYGTTDHGTNWASYPSSMVPYKTTNYMGMTSKFAILTGLTPDTEYYFVIKDSDGTSQRYWFKTCPNINTEKLSFVSGGDSRSGQTQRRNSNMMVAKIRPHAVLFGGDLVNTPGNSSVQTWFDDWMYSYTSDNQIIPLVHSFGNHEDYGTGGPEFISELFDTPYDVYYKVTFGGDLFSVYTLNGELLPGHTIANASKRSSQTAWLASTLPSDPAIWKSAQYHRPIVPHYSGKGEGADEFNDWANLFYDYGVRLVMESDAHVTKLTEEVKPAMGTASGSSSNWFVPTTAADDPNKGITFTGEGAWGTIRTPDDSHPITTGMTSMYQFAWITVDQCAIEIRTIDTQSPATVPEHAPNDLFSISSGLDAQIWKPSGLPTGVRSIRRCYAPDTDFEADLTTAFVGQTINFTDLSLNTPTSWSWNFGDGGTSTQQNPSYSYSSTGTYTVTLTATNSDGSDVETKTGYITIIAPTAPTADFSGDQTVVSVGTTINFTDLSTGAPASWSWSFPGGTPTSSTAQNPSITYNSAGTYDVSLTATNVYGNDTETKVAYITVSTGGSISVTIATGNDDAEEFRVGGIAGDMYLTSSDLEIGNDGGDEQYVGLRFQNVPLPHGAIVTNAFLRFRADESDGAGSQLNIYIAGEDTDNAAQYTTANYNISSRNFTTNQLTWPDGTVPAWNAGTIYDAPDITNIVQEIADRPGWAQNNSMAFMLWSDIGESSERVADSYEGSYPAELIIDWIAPPAPVSDFSGTPNSICAGESVSFTDLSSNNPTSWSWTVSGPATLNSTQQNPSFTFNTPGTYTVELAASNLGGTNTYTETAYITVHALPNVNAGSDVEVCDGDQVTLSASGANTYSWNNGINDGTAFTPSTSLTYTVTGTDVNGCTNTDNVNVTVNSNPIVNAGTDVAVCDGDQVTLNASGASSYSWDNGVNDGTPFTPATTQTYTVIGTDGNGCTGSDQIIVTVNSLPNVNAGLDQTVCEGDLVTLSGSGALTYAWDNGVNDGIAFTATSSLVYTVVGTDANGCTGNDQVSITVNALPNVVASNDVTICDGSSTTISVSGASTYSWNSGLGSGASHTLSPNTSTTYIVTGTGANGCTNTDQVVVNVNPLPNINVASHTDPSACATSTGSIEIGGSGNGDVSWSGTANGNANNVNLPYTITGLAAGSYNIEITDANGCVSNLVSQSLTDPSAPADPIVTASGPLTICDGDSVVLSSSYSNGNTWTTTATSSSITVHNSGSYAVSYTDGSGCTSTSSTVVVTVNSLPNVVATGSTAICEGESATISATGAINFSWDNSLGSGATHVVSPTSTTTYYVTGTDGNGCSNTDNVSITVNPLPTVTANAGIADTLCIEEQGVILPDGTPAGGTYSGTGVSNGEFNPNSAGVGTHDVVYTYTDGNNCSDSATSQITVTICTSVGALVFEDAVIYPNPTNDFITIEFKKTRNGLIEIFSANGQKIVSENFESRTQLKYDVQYWAKGSYTIRISDTGSNETHIQQIIVQ